MRPTGSSPGSPGDEADAAPEAERLIADAETLRALADPLRLRILETMVTRLQVAWTAKELAGRLDVPQTRLYHHLELLLERDLIRVAAQRVVSGIIETRYRVAARSFRLDRRLLAGDDTLQESGRELLHSVFDTARDDLARALREHRTGDGDEPADDGAPDDRPIVSRGLARLAPRRAAEFRARLTDLLAEFGADADDDDAPEEPGLDAWTLLVAFYRQHAGAEAASDD